MKTPHPLVSLIPFAFLISVLACIITAFGADSLSGASQVALLASGGLAAGIALIVYRVPWSRIEEAIVGNFKTVSLSLLILLFIGAVAGTWMISGIVPTLMYYGLKILSPKIFLFAVCVICAIVSVVTGSSWTTIATIGVALIGVGMALGFSTGWTAGAIISGAYFGDKISPLSDTTVLASASAEVPIFEHIRYMMITTVPSIAITCIVFLIMSLCHGSCDSVEASEFSDALCGAFNITPWLLLVPLATGYMIYKRLPALLTLFVSSLLAAIAAIIAQPDLVLGIGDGSMFKGMMITVYGDTAVQTSSEILNGLVQTHGVVGMLNTVFLIICAATFGGVLIGSGMIDSITSVLAKGVKGRTSLVGVTAFTGLFNNLFCGDQYLSIVLTCNLNKALFKKMGYEPRLLSRSAEDSATVGSVLVPWNSCGMTQSTVLRVPTLEYLPFCFFNLLSPLMTVFVAAIGYKINGPVKKDRE